MKISNGVNKKISFPIAIIIIIVCAVLVGGLTVWQYLEIPEGEGEGEILKVKEPEEVVPKEVKVIEEEMPEVWKLCKRKITEPPNAIIVSGIITETDVELSPFYTMKGTSDILDPGDYSFELLSSTGEVFSKISFEAFYFLNMETGEKIAPFGFSIPYPVGTTKIVLKYRDNILKEVIVSSNTPVVKIVSLKDLGNENYEINWEASDLDGDNLTYSISYSHDCDTWFPLELSETITSFSYTFNTFNLPGGDNSFIRIVTTDGVNTVNTLSAPFSSVSNKPPSTFIDRPSDGSVFNKTDEIFFRGWAYDPEEFGLGGASFVWTSNIDGVIGRGEQFTTSDLSLGNHTITLKASDSKGLSNSASINIVITTETRPDLTVKDILFKPESIKIGDSVTIKAEIFNVITDAFCDVTFYDGDPDTNGNFIGQTMIPALPNTLNSARISHKFTVSGAHDIYVVISNSDPEESNIKNNKAFKSVIVLE